MYRRLWLLLVLSAAAAPAAAQDARAREPTPATASADDVEAELVRQIDELVPVERAVAERARETRRVRDSLRAAAAPELDTVSLAVGPLRIVTLAGQEDEARRLFRSELDRMGAVAHDAADALAEAPIVFQYSPMLRTIRLDGPSREVALRRYWGEATVRRRIRVVLGDQVARALPSVLRVWLGQRSVFLADDLSALHRSLVLDGSRSGTACGLGDSDACWASFGLSGSTEPIGDWYGPDQIRALAGRRQLGSWLECSESPGMTSEACYRPFLESGRAWTRAIPFRHTLRADLVAFALHLGGEGAMDRLLAGWPQAAGEAEMTLPELGREMQARLAASAGIPADELMRRWRDRVMAVEPRRHAGLERTRLATGFWVLFFAALAMRSTRWRLG